jgi:hypothetical protein
MANINTHGIKINGLRKAAHETKGLSPYGDVRTQISYDRDTGDIYTNDHIGDDWSRYYDPAVITVCFAKRHMTQQQIADRIADALAETEMYGL